MKRTFLLLAALVALAFSSLKAQTQSFQRLSYPAIVNGAALQYPFAGGLNAPQFSPVDLNNDGRLDLVVFDRAGNTILTFLNNGAANTSDYAFAPEYACNFPALNDWALLRDYNQDGAADIFCVAHQAGAQEIQAYRGYFENNMLKFKPILFYYPNCASCDPRYIWYPDQIPGFYNNLPISKSDVPAFDDVDGDGDLDLLTFPSGTSAHVWFFKNTSVESGFGLDSLRFVAASNCWGGFYENGLEACRATLATAPGLCADPFTEPAADDRENRHPGASLTTIDAEGDGDKDLLLGNISFPCLNLLVNCGTPQQAWMCQQDTLFPVYNTTVNVNIFVSSFHLDVDNDGKKDLLACPNAKTIGEDQKCVWFYKNTAAVGTHFELESKSFLADDMIDLGTGAHPAIADVNADGLLDLVVGNTGFYTFGNPNNARLYLFLNTGSSSAPVFTLADNDWLGMSEFVPDDFDFSPTFGDLDGDSDLDLLVGSSSGGLYAYFNNAGPGAPMQMQRDFNPMWLSMDIGLASAPTILDLDGDGRKDVAIGERSGNINFFKNNGSPTEPLFGATPTIQVLGGVNTTLPLEAVGFSTPSFLPQPDGTLLLVTGAQGGHLEAYSAAGASASAFPIVSELWGGVDEGNRSHPAFADLDGDGTLEMVCGNFRGGLSVYKTVLKDCTATSLAETPQRSELQLKIQPNPVRESAQVIVTGTQGPLRWQLRNALGQMVQTGESASSVFTLQTADWTPGIYLLEVLTGDRKQGVGRIVR